MIEAGCILALIIWGFGFLKEFIEGFQKPLPPINNRELYNKDLLSCTSSNLWVIKRHHKQMEKWQREGKYS